ncbi:MAG TPA: LysM peptidoglycan-binding domain-containing protein [Gemmatimonadaceae bacterium]|nr:LysM peptidoglycan-binding domain-containing protein [Gemmatimonadaceae bacterium]
MSSPAHRAVLREPISRRRELALQFTVLVGIGVVAGLMIVLGTYLHRGDARAGRREAQLQLARVLEPGEQVLARADVAQRRWWDHFRETPGVLVATDRRLLFVGTVPPALFRERGGDPPLYVERSIPYDTTVVARRRRVLGGAVPGILVRADGEAERFTIPSAERAAADSLISLVTQRRAARLAEYERRQAMFDSIAALPPPPPEVHRVAPGQTLYGIAAQYNVTPEVLRLMNGLTSDRIRIGQELVVRRYRRINGAVVPYYGPG